MHTELKPDQKEQLRRTWMQTKQHADILPGMMCSALTSTSGWLPTPLQGQQRCGSACVFRPRTCVETDAWLLDCTTLPKRAPRHFSPRYAHWLWAAAASSALIYHLCSIRSRKANSSLLQPCLKPKRSLLACFLQLLGNNSLTIQTPASSHML